MNLKIKNMKQLDNLKEFVQDSMIMYAPEEFHESEQVEAKRRWSAVGGLARHADALHYISEVDQELSLLTEKYETQKHNAYFLLNQSNDWEEKYNKLKEAFNDLNEKHANLRWASTREREITKNKWLKEAGLKEQ